MTMIVTKQVGILHNKNVQMKTENNYTGFVVFFYQTYFEL